MQCDINNGVTVTLTLDIAAFAALQQALVYYVDKGDVPPGSPARDLMWKLTTHLKSLSAPPPSLLKPEETLPATLPENPVNENLTLIPDDTPPVPEYEWDEEDPNPPQETADA